MDRLGTYIECRFVISASSLLILSPLSSWIEFSTSIATLVIRLYFFMGFESEIEIRGELNAAILHQTVYTFVR